MSPETNPSRFRPGPDLLTSALTEEEVVILHLKQGAYFSLDHVGAAVWRHLAAAPRTVTELTAFVEAHYQVSAEGCRGDLEVFLDALLAQDLLHRQEA